MVASLTQETASGPLRTGEPSADQEQERGWSPAWLTSAGSLLIGLLGLIGLHWSTASETVRVWYVSETFNHCFLIFPISAYLIWRRLDRLKALEPRLCLPGLLPLLGGSLLWLVGNTAGVLLAEQIALVAMAQAMVLTLLGWRVVRAILFPLFFWVFAVPVGTELIPFFQHLTAELVVPLLRLSGIPVFLENLYLYIPSGSFEVAEACSGVRYLISTVTLGFLASHILFQSNIRRAIFVLLSFIVPIFANGIRAYGIVMIAHLSDYEYAIGADHLIYGWIFFSLVTFCLLGIGLAMRGNDDVAPDVAQAIGGTTSRLIESPRRIGLAFLLACFVASVGQIYKGYMELGILDGAAEQSIALNAAAPWSATDDAPRDWRPHYPFATMEHRQAFQGPDGLVDVHAAFYAYQRQGAEIVNAINRPLGADDTWRRMSSGRQVVQIGSREVTVRQLVGRSTQGDRLLWVWYWIDDRFTSNRYLAKLLEVKGKLLSRRGEAAVITISTLIEESPERAEERLRSFLGHVDPIDAALTTVLARADG